MYFISYVNSYQIPCFMPCFTTAPSRAEPSFGDGRCHYGMNIQKLLIFYLPTLHSSPWDRGRVANFDTKMGVLYVPPMDWKVSARNKDDI